MVFEFFFGLAPTMQALLAGCMTWGLTAVGAASVFLLTDLKKTIFDGMLGFAAGVMIAASFWSLLAPSIEMSRGIFFPIWLPAAVGFIGGGLFLLLLDKILPHLHAGLPRTEAEGIKTRWRGTTLLILAITLHNVPEGLALGFAFGAAALGMPAATIGVAIALAIGIGLQNLPEGMAVSMPLLANGMTKRRSFFYGQLSAIVEPISAVIGAFAVIAAKSLLPVAMGFAAGAMIYVVVEELIPQSQRGLKTDVATMGAMIGFVIMMMLDVGLG